MMHKRVNFPPKETEREDVPVLPEDLTKIFAKLGQTDAKGSPTASVEEDASIPADAEHGSVPGEEEELPVLTGDDNDSAPQGAHAAPAPTGASTGPASKQSISSLLAQIDWARVKANVHRSTETFVRTTPVYLREMLDSADRSTKNRAIAQAVMALGIVFVAAAIMVLMIATQARPPARSPSERVYTIQALNVGKADHRPVITVFGTTVAGQTVDLRSLVSGEIVSVHPQLNQGESIAQGSVLVEIDRFSYEGAVVEARANLREATARLAEIEAGLASEQDTLTRLQEQLSLAERDVERSEELLGRGSGTQKSVDDRRLVVSQRAQLVEQGTSSLSMEAARAEQQSAAIERLEWRVQQAERDLANTSLVAPFDAVVLTESAGIGRNVSASDLLVTLYREDDIEARFVLTDRQFGRLIADGESVLGREVEVIWRVGGEPLVYPAKIARIGAEVQSDRGGVELFAIVDTRGQETDLRPGAFVEVRVPDKLFQDSIQIPETAIYGGNSVYVVEDERLAKRPVRIAAFSGVSAIVTEGLEDGEKILATRIADARDGIKVVEAAPVSNSDAEPAAKENPPAIEEPSDREIPVATGDSADDEVAVSDGTPAAQETESEVAGSAVEEKPVAEAVTPLETASGDTEPVPDDQQVGGGDGAAQANAASSEVQPASGEAGTQQTANVPSGAQVPLSETLKEAPEVASKSDVDVGQLAEPQIVPSSNDGASGTVLSSDAETPPDSELSAALSLREAIPVPSDTQKDDGVEIQPERQAAQQAVDGQGETVSSGTNIALSDPVRIIGSAEASQPEPVLDALISELTVEGQTDSVTTPAEVETLASPNQRAPADGVNLSTYDAFSQGQSQVLAPEDRIALNRAAAARAAGINPAGPEGNLVPQPRAKPLGLFGGIQQAAPKGDRIGQSDQ